ncbi:MAG TPA: integrin alpha [Planctomycetota bacterium]|nr:integrin alpha [Planctomycetota bacterium]
MESPRLRGLTALALLAAAASTAAQTALVVAAGDTGEDDSLGWSVAIAGDVDGDGRDDIIAGARNDGPWYHGGARLISGADGSELRSWIGRDEYDRLGTSVAGVGDVDDDGVPDVLVGATQLTLFGTWTGPGYADLYSGADGQLIERFSGQAAGDEFGACVALVGDHDGDGRRELAIGAPRYDDGSDGDVGQLRVFSGATLALLATLEGPVEYDQLGAAAADAGDVDGDGMTDLLVGLPNYFGQIEGGHVHVYSGATWALLFSAEGGHYDDWLGRSVCGLGDVDGDGLADVAAGMPGQNRALVYSGGTGELLYTVQGKQFSEFGYVVAPAGDLDGDGLLDLLVTARGDDLPPGAAGGNSGSVTVVSGGDGRVLWKFWGPVGSQGFGAAMATGGDLDADGHPDAVFGEPWKASQSGRVHGYSLHPWNGLGHGLPGSLGLPSLWGEGLLGGGTTLLLRLTSTYAAAPVAIIVGLSAIDAPFKGGVLVPQPALIVSLVADATGQLQLATTWPAGVPAGVELFLQAWIADASGPAGFTASSGIRAVTP